MTRRPGFSRVTSCSGSLVIFILFYFFFIQFLPTLRFLSYSSRRRPDRWRFHSYLNYRIINTLACIHCEQPSSVECIGNGKMSINPVFNIVLHFQRAPPPPHLDHTRTNVVSDYTYTIPKNLFFGDEKIQRQNAKSYTLHTRTPA